MIKKLVFTFFLTACALLTSASAQTESSPEKQAAVKELVALVTANNTAEDIARAMMAQMEATREATVKTMLDARTDLNAQERKSLETTLIDDQRASAKRFEEKFMQKLNYNELISETASVIYDKHYTVEEIRELTAFYRTPTGQKTLKLMPSIAAESMRMVQERLVPKIPLIINELLEEDRTELEKKINARKPKTTRGEGD